MDNGVSILFYMAISIIAVLGFAWHLNRSRNILQKWADQNGYQIITAKYAWFFRGPFFLSSSKNQSVYRVLARDAQGRTRSGWVRCGSWLWGDWSNQTSVSWDDEG
ncbi:MAG: hypothetical protein ABI210_13305 [Abditibacteriaceae bacterium]